MNTGLSGLYPALEHAVRMQGYGQFAVLRDIHFRRTVSACCGCIQLHAVMCLRLYVHLILHGLTYTSVIYVRWTERPSPLRLGSACVVFPEHRCVRVRTRLHRRVIFQTLGCETYTHTHTFIFSLGFSLPLDSLRLKEKIQRLQKSGETGSPELTGPISQS